MAGCLSGSLTFQVHWCYQFSKEYNSQQAFRCFEESCLPWAIRLPAWNVALMLRSFTQPVNHWSYPWTGTSLAKREGKRVRLSFICSWAFERISLLHFLQTAFAAKTQNTSSRSLVREVCDTLLNNFVDVDRGDAAVPVRVLSTTWAGWRNTPNCSHFFISTGLRMKTLRNTIML